ncbi:MAG: hypothetical protein SOR93_01480 [Clostridiales Family XIII bacterium]|nr:hypothetical protein [Clostridia bacterium]MDY3009920.1 hypothetical protein [Clostridiales Family XIII bacterium]
MENKKEIADIVILNANVYLVDDQDTMAEAIAVKGSKILCVGKESFIRSRIGSTTEIIDAAGKTVMPGPIQKLSWTQE